MVTVVGKGNGFVTKKMARPSWPQLCSILLVLLLCLAVSFTQGQDCEEITEDVGCSQFGLNGTCFFLYRPRTSILKSISFNSVGSLVFVAPNVPLARAQGTVVTYIGGINFITIPEPCRSLLIRMVCVSYLRPCVNTSTGEGMYSAPPLAMFFSFFLVCLLTAEPLIYYFPFTQPLLQTAFPIQTCRYQCDWFCTYTATKSPFDFRSLFLTTPPLSGAVQCYLHPLPARDRVGPLLPSQFDTSPHL